MPPLRISIASRWRTRARVAESSVSAAALEQSRRELVLAAHRRRQPGGEQPAVAILRARAQGRRALERAGRGRVGAAPGGALRRRVEAGGDLVVGSGGGRGEVPGPRVGRGVVGQRSVGAPAIGGRRGPVDDPAQQRVREAEAAAVRLQQTRRLARLERSLVDPELARRGDHRLERPVERRRGDQQQRRRLGARGLDPAPEGLAERPAGHRRRVDRGRPSALVLAQHRGQLEQRERVAERELEHALGRRRGERGPVEQRKRVGALEPAEVEPGERLGGERLPLGRLPGGDQQRRAGVLEAAPGVGEALGRGAVEPVRVVDHDQQRPRGGGRADQPEEAGEGRQPLVDDALAYTQRERRRDRRRLRLREPGEPGEQRARQLAERGERQLGLGLDSGRADHRHPGAAPARLEQERRLADPGLAPHEQGATSAPAGVVEQRLDALQLGFPTDQHGGPTLGRPRPGGQIHPPGRSELGVRPVLFRPPRRTVGGMHRATIHYLTAAPRSASGRPPARRTQARRGRRPSALLALLTHLR